MKIWLVMKVAVNHGHDARLDDSCLDECIFLSFVCRLVKAGLKASERWVARSIAGRYNGSSGS
jgi:hypothetical protein